MNIISKSTVLGLIAIGLSTLSSRASLDYDFSFTYANGQTVNGEIAGTPESLNPNAVDVDSILSFSIDGVTQSGNFSATFNGAGLGRLSSVFALVRIVIVNDAFKSNSPGQIYALIDGIANEKQAAIFDSNDSYTYGNPFSVSPDSWTFTPVVAPVPEPSTILGGSLLLLPFGLSMVRILRKQKNG